MKFKDGSACPAPDVEALARDYEQAWAVWDYTFPGSPISTFFPWSPSPMSICVWSTFRWAWAAAGSPWGSIF